MASHGDSIARQQRNVANGLFKTSLCKLHLQGKCELGERCNYAHSQDELRCTQRFHKTRLCDFYRKGHCRHGSSCRHAHGEEELRQADGSLVQGDAPKRTLSLAAELAASFREPQFVVPSGHLTRSAAPVFVSAFESLPWMQAASHQARAAPPGLLDMEEDVPLQLPPVLHGTPAARRIPPGFASDGDEGGDLTFYGTQATRRIPPSFVNDADELRDQHLGVPGWQPSSKDSYMEAIMQSTCLLSRLGDLRDEPIAHKKAPPSMSSLLDDVNKSLNDVVHGRLIRAEV